MPRPSTHSLLLALAVIAGIILAAGCDDNTIEPIVETGSYSVYGYLTSRAEPHFVRVRPLRQSLGTSVDSLDVAVTLTNRTSGITHTLQDSVIVFEGVATHNYWSEFQPEPSTTYELVVDGSEGVARAQATTPTGVDPTVDPDSAQRCDTRVRMTFREAENPVRVDVGFLYRDTMRWVPRSDFQSPSPQDDQVLQFIPSGVLGYVIPTGLREPPPCLKLDDNTLYLAFLYVDPERKEPGEEFDVAFDPTESIRVKGGSGFFGAIRRDTITMKVDTTLYIP